VVPAPTRPAAYFELLDAAHGISNPGIIPAPEKPGYAFGGVSGLRVTTAIPAVSSAGWTVAIELLQVAGNRGYIFAKTDGITGARRNLALYSRPGRQGLTFYYRARGGQHSVRFAGTVADGAQHRLLLSVEPGPGRVSATATLTIDGGRAERRPVAGPVEDCEDTGGPGCAFYLGQRQSSSTSGGACVEHTLGFAWG